MSSSTILLSHSTAFATPPHTHLAPKLNRNRNLSPEKPHFLRLTFPRRTPPHRSLVTTLSPPLARPIRSSLSNSQPTSPDSPPIATPFIQLPELTPLAICKWTAIASLAVVTVKKLASIATNPFFWVYFSFTWVNWPAFPAIGIVVYGLYCLQKHLKGNSAVYEQVALLTSAVTCLTVISPAFFNGYLEGWPVVFFFVYHYFFFLEMSVRKRLYGDLQQRKHDSKWDVKIPTQLTSVFSVLIMVGHWVAGYEGIELCTVPGGWSTVWMWILIALVIFMRYHSVFYLHNYSEKMYEPTAVVQFGPYRWVRHPIYSSTMLLFASYLASLRAPLSLLFVTAVCLVYYGRKASLEEELMMENFGERYAEYKNKVRYKLIPLLY